MWACVWSNRVSSISINLPIKRISLPAYFTSCLLWPTVTMGYQCGTACWQSISTTTALSVLVSFPIFHICNLPVSNFYLSSSHSPPPMIDTCLVYSVTLLQYRKFVGKKVKSMKDYWWKSSWFVFGQSSLSYFIATIWLAPFFAWFCWFPICVYVPCTFCFTINPMFDFRFCSPVCPFA